MKNIILTLSASITLFSGAASAQEADFDQIFSSVDQNQITTLSNDELIQTKGAGILTVFAGTEKLTIDSSDRSFWSRFTEDLFADITPFEATGMVSAFAVNSFAIHCDNGFSNCSWGSLAQVPLTLVQSSAAAVLGLATSRFLFGSLQTPLVEREERSIGTRNYSTHYEVLVESRTRGYRVTGFSDGAYITASKRDTYTYNTYNYGYPDGQYAPNNNPYTGGY